MNLNLSPVNEFDPSLLNWLKFRIEHVCEFISSGVLYLLVHNYAQAQAGKPEAGRSGRLQPSEILLPNPKSQLEAKGQTKGCALLFSFLCPTLLV